MISIVRQCTNCKGLVEISSSDLNKIKIDIKSGKSIWLTYFDCPFCSKTHFVQIDDVRTNNLLAEMGKVFASFIKARKYGHKTKKQSAKYHSINRDLNEIRKDLQKEYSGMTVQVPGHKEISVLDFTEIEDIPEVEMKS